MGKIKDTLNQIGFAFSPSEEIQERNRILAKINDLRRAQKKIYNVVTIFDPPQKEQLRAEYKRLSTEIISLGGKSWMPKEQKKFGIHEK